MTAVPEITAGRENGHRRPKGYDLGYSPHGGTRAILDEVDEVLEEYQDHLPLSVRQIFYRLVGRYEYPKTEQAYAGLTEKLVRARRAKLIPFDAIRDDGIVRIENTFYESIENFHDETGRRIQNYRRDRQEGQPQYIELWCEAAGMLGQLNRVAEDYSVPVYSCGGFGSLTANYKVARRALARDVATVILHVGDFDPSGESIFESMTEDATAFVEADRVIQTCQIIPIRVALTADQVEEYDLSTAPPKRSDSRSKNWTGGTCQLEALAPDQLARIVTDAIEKRIDWDVFGAVYRQEASDRASLLALPAGCVVSVRQITLSSEQLDHLADLVAEKLAAQSAEMIDAGELARRLGKSREFVYANTAALGAVRLGTGPRPRLMFLWPLRVADAPQRAACS